jgi:AraC-like DNA-binding protein
MSARQSQPAPSRGFLASFVRVLPDTVLQRGIPSDAIWRELGLSAVPAPELSSEPSRVSSGALQRALDAAILLTGDPLMALHAAQAVRPLHLGSLGYALMSSPHGRDGLAVYERFQSLLCDELFVHHRVVKGLIEVRHESTGMPLPRNAHFWWFLLGARLAFARWVSGRDLVPVRLDIPSPRPMHAEAFDRFVGSPVRYDTPDCRELMPSDWLAWLNPNADPAMHTLMQTRTAQQMADRPRGDTLLAHARRAMAQHLEQGLTMSLDNISQSISRTGLLAATSSRQLQQRLADQGLTFTGLVDEVRRELALRLLRDTRQTVLDIAAACGYSDVSPFHRAVKRWTGLTPAQVRLQARNARSDMA